MTSQPDDPQLPGHWQMTTLGDVCEQELGGGTPARGDPLYWDGEIPWITSADLAADQVSLDRSTGYISEAGLEHSSTNLVPVGSLIVATRVGVGKAVVNRIPMAINQDLAGLRISQEVDPAFLAWHLKSPRTQSYFAQNIRGTTIKGITRAVLRAAPIVLPPRPEQERIVAALEEAFHQIDRGLLDLKHANYKAERFSDAAVDAVLPIEAFDGMPTDGWRLKTAPEIAKNASHSLSIGPFGSNLKVSDYQLDGVPLIFVRNIRSKQFQGPEARYVAPAKAEELSAHQVEPGDLLITKMGDPPGDCCIYPADHPRAVITADCIRFAVDPAKADPRFVALLFQSRLIKAQIDARTKGVAQRKISLRTFKTIQLPMPDDLLQQQQVAARLEDQLREGEQLTASVARAATQAESLKQAVLGSTLSGERRLAK